MDVGMVMKGLAKMQDDIWNIWNSPNYSQQQKDQVVRDFTSCLDTILDLTSPMTIEREVYKLTEAKKRLKDELST